MLLLTLLACGSGPVPNSSSPIPPAPSPTQGPTGSTAPTGDTSAEPPWLTDDRYVFVNAGEVIPVPVYCSANPLLAGMDLDHDGVLEWAAANAWTCDDSEEIATVHVFEGTEEVASRQQNDFSHQVTLMAAADVDADGFSDLLWSACEGNRCNVHVSTGVDASQDAVLALAEPGDDVPATPQSFDVHPGSPDLILAAWWQPYIGITFGPLPTPSSTDDEPFLLDPTEALLDDRGRHAKDTTETTFVSSAHLIHEPNGPPTHFLLGTQSLDDTHQYLIGDLRICPLQSGLDLPTDCPILESDGSIGFRMLDADLDGDGVQELVSSSWNLGDDQGALWIFERDGTWRATIRGTSTYQFGGDPTFVVDDHGDRWLLASDRARFDKVYAFRAEGLAGEITADEADRFYVDAEMGFFDRFTAYRETADGPLWLLLSSFGKVFRTPFEP